MKNKSVLALVLLCFLSACVADAKLTLSDLANPKAPAYRVGISEIPENQYVEPQEILPPIRNSYAQFEDNDADVSYADLTLKRISREVSQDLLYEEQDMVSDLSLLWQGAAMQSDTINFALYKLANPDADKPQKSTVKNMLKTIASMSTLAGASMANPLLAGTSLIGGNVLGIMSQDTKSLNYKYTKVTDADMILLIRKVEDLQQNAVNLYYDYMTAKQQYELTTKLVKERETRFHTAQKNNAARELIVVTDAYYRTALDKQKNARAEFLSKRAALEQFVGNETFTQFEQELVQREKSLQENSEKTSESTSNTELATGYSASTYEVENPQMLAAAKRDKYSTKGLIFIHDGQPVTETKKDEITSTPTASEVTNSNNKKKKKNKEQQHVEELPVSQVETKSTGQTFNGVELMPLDEIKRPDLSPNGYSIFRE